MAIFIDTQNRIYENANADSANDQQLPFVRQVLLDAATGVHTAAPTVLGAAWAAQASVNNQ